MFLHLMAPSIPQNVCSLNFLLNPGLIFLVLFPNILNLSHFQKNLLVVFMLSFFMYSVPEISMYIRYLRNFLEPISF